MLRGPHPVCFVAFDLLWLNGEDLRPLPLVERRARLGRLLRRRANHIITEALAIEGRGKALMAVAEAHDLEGIVAKRKSDPYRRGISCGRLRTGSTAKPMMAATCSMAIGGYELFMGAFLRRRPLIQSRRSRARTNHKQPCSKSKVLTR
jgi:bifunctional non-homologous end joining protein LigD